MPSATHRDKSMSSPLSQKRNISSLEPDVRYIYSPASLCQTIFGGRVKRRLKVCPSCRSATSLHSSALCRYTHRYPAAHTICFGISRSPHRLRVGVVRAILVLRQPPLGWWRLYVYKLRPWNCVLGWPQKVDASKCVCIYTFKRSGCRFLFASMVCLCLVFVCCVMNSFPTQCARECLLAVAKSVLSKDYSRMVFCLRSATKYRHHTNTHTDRQSAHRV